MSARSRTDAVSAFHRLLEGYAPPGPDDDHAAILADRLWEAVTAAACAARDGLLAILTDPSEIEALTVPSPHAALAAAEGTARPR